MIFCVACTVCKKECQNVNSYVINPKIGGTITKACCKECCEKTHENWINNGWKILEQPKE
jgi:hypothetical protein